MGEKEIFKAKASYGYLVWPTQCMYFSR